MIFCKLYKGVSSGKNIPPDKSWLEKPLPLIVVWVAKTKSKKNRSSEETLSVYRELRLFPVKYGRHKKEYSLKTELPVTHPG
jgi:hypothetical protein